MSYISLSECIRGLDSTESLVLERDKVTGWHATIAKGHQASVEEICAEVNLLDPNEMRVITELFHYSIDDVVKRERASYEEALKNVKGVSQKIQSYKITNQSLLYDIALKAAVEDGFGVSMYIQNYGIKDEKKRYQIALTAAMQNGAGVSWRIENYGIKDEKKRYQIALTAAMQNGSGVSQCIE